MNQDQVVHLLLLYRLPNDSHESAIKAVDAMFTNYNRESGKQLTPSGSRTTKLEEKKRAFVPDTSFRRYDKVDINGNRDLSPNFICEVGDSESGPHLNDKGLEWIRIIPGALMVRFYEAGGALAMMYEAGAASNPVCKVSFGTQPIAANQLSTIDSWGTVPWTGVGTQDDQGENYAACDQPGLHDYTLYVSQENVLFIGAPAGFVCPLDQQGDFPIDLYYVREAFLQKEVHRDIV